MQTYVTNEVFNNAINKLGGQLTEVLTAMYGRDPRYPIVAADLDPALFSIFDTLNSYYKKGEKINVLDLPPGVASTDYVNARTTGTSHTDTAPGIIDEVVVARGSEANLNARMNTYSLSSALITNINALTSGTINAARTAAHDHNDSSSASREATGCHTMAAVTDLVTTLAGKVAADAIIAGINASTEGGGTPLKISKDKLPDHKDLNNVHSTGVHSIDDVDLLNGRLAVGEGAASTLTGETKAGYATHGDMISCMLTVLQHYVSTLPPGTFPCWQTVP